MKKKWTVPQILLSGFMISITLTMLIPLLNLLAISLSHPSVSKEMSGISIFPKEFTWMNYQLILENKNIMPAMFNSIFITVVGTFLNVALTTTAAYALSYEKLVGRNFFMGFFVIMLLFDPGLIPEYLTIQSLNLMGSQWSVILVAAVNAYYLIILMRYFQAVPKDLYEAASIDGAGHLRLFFHIALPQAQAGVATITLFYGVLRWNEYFKAGLYITDPGKTTLPVILREFLVLNDTTKLIGNTSAFDYETISALDLNALKYATIIFSMMPILLVYPFVLKIYAKDMVTGAVKG